MGGDTSAGTLRRLDTLTALRFPAAAMIVACHAGETAVWFSPVWRLQMGVTTFFVLSGFVLTWGCADMETSSFYGRRVARIVPLYLLAVTLGLAVDLLLGLRPSALVTFTTFTLTQAWIPHLNTMWPTIDSTTWSLSGEVFFYLAFPAIVAAVQRLHRPNRRAMLLGCMAFTTLYFLVLDRDSLLGGLVWSPVMRLPEFVAGVLLCLEVKDGMRVRWWAAIAGVVVAIPAAVAAPSPVAEAGVAMIPSVLVVGACASNDLRSCWRPPKALVELGTWSYALYLLHFPLMLLLRNRGWLAAVLISLVAIGLSGLVYARFELPMEQSLRRRLAVDAPARAVPGRLAGTLRGGGAVS